MVNNPTLDAMAEIVTQEEKEESGAKLALVVSIGTGVLPHVEVEDVAIFVPMHSRPSSIFLTHFLPFPASLIFS